jgi:hypothetical protein
MKTSLCMEWTECKDNVQHGVEYKCCFFSNSVLEKNSHFNHQKSQKKKKNNGQGAKKKSKNHKIYVDIWIL